MREDVSLSLGGQEAWLTWKLQIYGVTEEYFFKGGQTLSFNAELSCECPGAPKVIAFSVPMPHLLRKHSVPVHSGEKQDGGRS